MENTFASKINANDLHKIALMVAGALKDPASWTTHALARDRNGDPVSVYSAEAVVLSVDGHVYKAAQRHFGYRETVKIPPSQMSICNAALRLIDAQVRYVSSHRKNGELVYASMIAQANDFGREHMISLFLDAASDLATGEDTIVSPYDAGVVRDLTASRYNHAIYDPEDDIGSDDAEGEQNPAP